MDLTQEIILQHGQLSPHKGRIKSPTLSAELANPLCGDILRIDIKVDKGEIIDMAFSGEGCLISQAAASLLIGKIKKVKDLNKIKKFNDQTVLKLLGIELTLSRVKCALLSLQTLKKAINIH